MAFDLLATQAAVRDAGMDGWLFYDFRRSNMVAHRVLGLSPHLHLTRRWFYWVPADGAPQRLVSAVEAHVLEGLPGERHVYRTWRELHEQLAAMLAGARTVAMEYVADNAIPYVSLVDAGTVEFVRALGVTVRSSADFAQRFEAVLTTAQLETHRTAGRRLNAAGERLVDWLRDQIRADVALSEYDVQQRLAAYIAAEGLEVLSDDPPLIAINGNAANPHYSPTRDRTSPIRRGDLLLMDYWARLPEPASIFADYTWMMYLGEQVPEEIAALFAVLRAARDTGIALLRQRFEAGARVAGCAVDDAVRAVIADAGYGAAIVHRSGHNISTVIHGNGAHLDNFETHDSRPLLANTCTSMEPGIYLPARALGLRTEVDVLLLPGGIEVTGALQSEVRPLL